MNAQLHREAAEDTTFRKQIVFDNHLKKVFFSLQIPKQKKGAILTKDTVKKEQPYNRNQKDQLFRLVFSEKKYQLDLYNAINGTNYTDPEDLEMTTLEDVIFLGMKNDLSFIIGTSMNLYEHQSSTNLNMPLRGLIYFSQLYQQYVRRYGYSRMQNLKFLCHFQIILSFIMVWKICLMRKNYFYPMLSLKK